MCSSCCRVYYNLHVITCELFNTVQIMDRLSDSRSVGSGRSNKKRLPLPSDGNRELSSDGDLLSIISGDSQSFKVS